MIPTALLHMDKLPLTLNGKLDRKALPDPVLGSNKGNYIAPRNELETKLCKMFADVLGLESSNVGINDEFFRLGGNSILAIKLVTTIIKKTSLILNITDIFTHKNIKNIAHYLQNNTKIDIVIPLSNISKVEKQVLSFAQERLFFIDKYSKVPMLIISLCSIS